MSLLPYTLIRRKSRNSDLSHKTKLNSLNLSPMRVGVGISPIYSKLKMHMLQSRILIRRPRNLLRQNHNRAGSINVRMLRRPTPRSVSQTVNLVRSRRIRHLEQGIQIMLRLRKEIKRRIVRAKIVDIQSLLTLRGAPRPLSNKSSRVTKIRNPNENRFISIMRLHRLPTIVQDDPVPRLPRHLINRIIPVSRRRSPVSTSRLR